MPFFPPGLFDSLRLSRPLGPADSRFSLGLPLCARLSDPASLPPLPSLSPPGSSSLGSLALASSSLLPPSLPRGPWAAGDQSCLLLPAPRCGWAMTGSFPVKSGSRASPPSHLTGAVPGSRDRPSATGKDGSDRSLISISIKGEQGRGEGRRRSLVWELSREEGSWGTGEPGTC